MAGCILIGTKSADKKNSWIFECEEKEEGKEEIPVYFQREEEASAWGRGTSIFMETIKFAGTHDSHEKGVAGKHKRHVGGRSIRHNRVQTWRVMTLIYSFLFYEWRSPELLY